MFSTDQKKSFKNQTSKVQETNSLNNCTPAQDIISQQELQIIFQRFLTLGQVGQNNEAQDTEKLKKPPLGASKFSDTWPELFRLRNIMEAAYNREQLKLSQFQQFDNFFKLNKSRVKLMNYPDQIVLQTMRYAIFNKQQIPSQLVDTTIQIAKAYIVRKWEVNSYLFQTAFTNDIIAQGLFPPLDLYLEFVDSGLIQQNQQELIEVFSCNQHLFKSMSNKKELYGTLSKKRRLILYQFPYLINIFHRVSNNLSAGFHFERLRQYVDPILSCLQLPNQEALLDRYLPETRCQYLKIKSELTPIDLQYLFTTLKSIDDLEESDFKILYSTRPSKTPFVKERWMKTVKSLIQFWKVQQLCSNLLKKKNYHLSDKELEQIGELLKYQECFSVELIKNSMILVILKESTYRNQLLPKSVFKKILNVFNQIPDRNIKKQCSYIMLLQYFKLMEQNPEQRIQIVKQYYFPEPELQTILDEGREIALDILFSRKQQDLQFNQKKYFIFMKIVKNFMSCTKSLRLKNKAIQLCKKLKKINKLKCEDLKFYEDNITNAHEFIDFIEMQTKIGSRIDLDCVNNIIKILYRNCEPSILKSCLSTLQYTIKNRKFEQHFPLKFEEKVIQLVTNLYYENYITQECQLQILKLAIQSTNLSDTYVRVDLLIKFLLQVYIKSPVNSSLHIYSSVGFYMIAKNFNLKNQRNYPRTKDYFDKFISKSLYTFKKHFSSNSQGSVNILCVFVALAQNEILLPPQLIQQLTVLALKYPDFTQLLLVTVLLQVKNVNSQPISQKTLINICQILKSCKNNQIFGVHILERYFKREKKIPNSVRIIIEEITKKVKCESDPCKRLCNFYKNEVQKQ